MNELEKYMYIVNDKKMTAEEKEDLIHDKWLNYEMTNETEDELCDLIYNQTILLSYNYN